MTDLWPQLCSLLPEAERPVRYIDHEFGAVHHDESLDDECSFVMLYPDTYELGQANQAVRILVNDVNQQDGMWAERAFLPSYDFGDIMRQHDLPLFSLESCAPIAEFDVFGITLPHELAATNALEALDLARIPLRTKDRAEDDPIVIAGGPCTYNPEPYAPFFDAMCIGEGEEWIVDVMRVVARDRRSGLSRACILRDLAGIDGTYVPSLYKELDDDAARSLGYRVASLDAVAPQVIKKRIYNGFATSDAWEPCIVPYCDLVHDRLNVEILRGCSRGCRFCQAGMTYRPVRERSADNIVQAVIKGLDQTGYDEVSLTSLSTTDHSQIEQILSRLNEHYHDSDVEVSIPSQRLDSFGAKMAELVAGAKRGGLTFAPEAGTQRLRDVINKNVTEDDLFGAIDAAFNAGWRRCKLYFMIGLPTETDDDIKGIARLAQQAYDHARAAVPDNQRGRVKISISCALFVPKSQTPFQWDGQIPPEEAQRRINLLRHSIKYRAVDVNWHDPKSSFVEAILSRGNRACADLVEHAFHLGARYDAWTEYFNEDAWRTAADDCRIDIQAAAQRAFNLDEVLPWQHITCGVTTPFLKAEYRRSRSGVTTPDCTFGDCVACGLCPDYGIDPQTQEVRHA